MKVPHFVAWLSLRRCIYEADIFVIRSYFVLWSLLFANVLVGNAYLE